MLCPTPSEANPEEEKYFLIRKGDSGLETGFFLTRSITDKTECFNVTVPVLCFVFYVLCFVFYVLCFLFYVLCFMFLFCILCFAFYVLCFVFYVLCFEILLD